MLEQQRAQPPALLVVLYDECDLGLVGADAVVTRDRDHLVAEERDECHATVVVDFGQPFELHRGRAGNRREETEVEGFVREPVVQAGERVHIVAPDRTDTHGAAVREYDVAFPLRGVLGHVGHLIGHDLACTS